MHPLLKSQEEKKTQKTFRDVGGDEDRSSGIRDTCRSKSPRYCAYTTLSSPCTAEYIPPVMG